MNRTLILVAVLAIAAASSAASAHDTWLLPSSMHVDVGRQVDLSLTSGMAFPADDFAIKPARIARADVRLEGVTRKLIAPRSAPLALRFRWTPTTPGVATIVVALEPKALTLRGTLIEEYLTEIDASPELRAQWKPARADAPWREVYTKFATSFVRVDPRSRSRRDAQGSVRGAGDSSWRTPSGLGLELVPETNPTTIVSGDTLVVRVDYKDRPLAGFAVGAERAPQPGDVRDAPSHRIFFSRTDAQGRARIPLNAAGRWLIKGTQLRRVSEPDVDWRSEFVTMTLSVGSR